MDARQALVHGAQFPYDGGAEFWRGDGKTPLPARDAAHATARGILADLSDRKGIKHELYDVDDGARAELTEAMAEIIRVGMA